MLLRDVTFQTFETCNIKRRRLDQSKRVGPRERRERATTQNEREKSFTISIDQFRLIADLEYKKARHGQIAAH